MEYSLLFKAAYFFPIVGKIQFVEILFKTWTMWPFTFYLLILALNPGANLNLLLWQNLKKPRYLFGFQCPCPTVRFILLSPYGSKTSFISWDLLNSVIQTSCTLNHSFPSQCKPTLIKNDIDYFPQFNVPDISLCIISSYYI